jgi:TonB family protein
MKTIASLILGLISIASFGQIEHISFYKKHDLIKEVAEKKARYKRVEKKVEGLTVADRLEDLQTGCVVFEKYFKEEKPIGIWKTYNNCSLVVSRNFENIPYSDSLNQDLYPFSSDAVGELDMVIPKFGKTEIELFQYLGKSIIYPLEAMNGGISGTVFVNFLIKRDGTVVPESIFKGHPILAYEAWRVVAEMPNWTPATKNGEPIDFHCSVTIRFTLK